MDIDYVQVIVNAFFNRKINLSKGKVERTSRGRIRYPPKWKIVGKTRNMKIIKNSARLLLAVCA